MSDIVEISADYFHEKVLESDEPVVVEFFSHSCPHCIKFKPIYEELAQILSTEAKFVRIDVLDEQNRVLAHTRGIRTVPTLEVFYRGRVIGNITGYHHLEKVYEAIKGFLMRKDENVGPGTPLESLHARHPRGVAKFSIVGCQIRWFKKTTISKKTRQTIRKKLRDMSPTLEKAMNFTREESLENRSGEIRLAVAPPVYLAVEYCQNNWHIGLETNEEPVGEVVREGGPYIAILDDKDVETENV